MGKFVDKNFEMASVRKMPIQVEMPANIIFPAACILSSIGLELSHSTLTALPKERVASLIIITMRFTVVRVEFYSNKVADMVAELEPETIIITSPHATMYADYFHVSPGNAATGSFDRFGAGNVKFLEAYDMELVSQIESIARKQDFPAGTLGEVDRELDHGTMVPLWFIRRKYKGGNIVRIGLSALPLTEHYRFGQIIQKAVDKLGRRAVVIASGDLSHKLQEYGPYGYAPEGPVYDQKIMDVCSRAAFKELFDFEEGFCERAAECGHRSFVRVEFYSNKMHELFKLPHDEASCKRAVQRRDQLEIELKQIAQTYHNKFLRVLPASKVIGTIIAEDKFHRRAFRKLGQQRNAPKK